MKVLHVTDGYRPVVGGMERAVESLATALLAYGVPTEVATLGRPDTPSSEILDGVQVHRIEGWSKHLRRFASDPEHLFHPTCPDPLLVRRLNHLVREFCPSVVHAHGWILNSCLALRLPAGTALVTTLHDYGLNCALKTFSQNGNPDSACAGPSLRRCLPCAQASYGAIKGTALTLGLRESRRRFDRVTTFLPISDCVAATVSELLPGTVRRLPSFVDDDLASIAQRTSRPEYLPDGPFIMYAGALTTHKGVDLLLDAHRRMRADIPLVLIGSSHKDFAIDQRFGTRPVTVLPAVPHEEIIACYAAATVAVVPSRWQEPLGLTAVEAMAVGTSLVVTEVGALPEIVRHEHTGLVVPPADPAALAHALDRLTHDAELRDRLGTAGARRAKSFSAAAVVPQILEAYDAACAAVSG